ncbi:MAG: hypothetical protein IPK10_06630 [Bacteroidetes bacterium]|nr:hypothetical protein [Bacteroidota bacterium]
MSKRKRIFIIIASTIGGLVMVLTALGWYFGPKIKGLAVEQINANLTVPVQVGEIDFSFLKKFPYASVNFQDVSTKGKKTVGTQEPLLVAKNVFLLFSWWDVFSDDIRLKSISIEYATCNLFVDRNGTENYDIFKKSENKNSTFNLQLQEIILKETGVRYHTIQTLRDYSFFAEMMNWKGQFTSDIYDLSGKGNLMVERFQTNGVNYIHHKESILDLNIHIDRTRKLYEIKESSLKIAALEFGVDGFFRDEKASTFIDVAIKSKQAGLKEMLSLVPGLYTEKLSQYDYSGLVQFDLEIRGQIGDKETPLILAKFSTEKASLAPKGTSYSLNNISFKGSFSNRISTSRPIERLQISNATGVLENQPFLLNLLLEDFANPWINLSAKSKVNLEVLSKFYIPDTMEAMWGQLNVDAQIKGKVKEANSWISSGNIELKDAGFKLKKSRVEFSGFQGFMSLIGNRLTLTNMQGKAAGSDFKVDGSFDNVYAYLLSENERVTGDAQIVCRNLDLNELLEDKSVVASADTTYRLDFSNRIRMNLKVQIGMLTFRKFQAWQLKGQLDLRNKVLNGNDISFKAFEGAVLMSGAMDASRPDSVLISCDAQLQKLDVTEVFTQLGNFGQEVMQDKNVKGKLTATVQFVSTWSKNLNCNFNKIYARSKVLIEKGELLNFEPMLALSKYLKSADLKNIKFETLENEIEISNQMIKIPSMEIKSSVMDLIASGTHSFENIVDYKLQLDLSQILGRKVREQNTEFGTIEDDGLGRMRLFLNMKGPLANPKITYDRKAIEQKIVHDVKKEKQDLKKILNSEFGWFKKDSAIQNKPIQKPKKPEELELELDED